MFYTLIATFLQPLTLSLSPKKSRIQHIQCIRSECPSGRYYLISCHPASCGAASRSKRSYRGGYRRPHEGPIGSDFHRKLSPQTRGGFAQRTVCVSFSFKNQHIIPRLVRLAQDIKDKDTFMSEQRSQIQTLTSNLGTIEAMWLKDNLEKKQMREETERLRSQVELFGLSEIIIWIEISF